MKILKDILIDLLVIAIFMFLLCVESIVDIAFKSVGL